MYLIYRIKSESKRFVARPLDNYCVTTCKRVQIKPTEYETRYDVTPHPNTRLTTPHLRRYKSHDNTTVANIDDQTCKYLQTYRIRTH